MDSATSTFGLIDRIRQGDREAFTPLFQKYRPRLAVFVHYRLSPQLRAQIEIDDILQETLLKAYEELEQFSYHGPGSYFRWLSRIAEHVIVDEARYRGREKRRAVEVVPFRSESNPAGPEPADNRSPSRLFAQSENVRSLMQKLDSLPANYREVILLSKVEGQSTAEVAAKLGKTRDATALLLHRALKHLRQIKDSGGKP
jgi:RNA polymerase sigma-70 factor, ECF subfamily